MRNLITLILGSVVVGSGLLAIQAGGPTGWFTTPMGVGLMAWALVERHKDD